MPATAELIGKVGRLRGQQPPDELGLTLTVRVLPSRATKTASQRCTACALSPDADALALVTNTGTVYALHLNKHRYTQIDNVGSTGTTATFMTRLSRRLFIGCSNGEIHCFDISSSSNRLAKLPGHRTAVASLSTKSDTEKLLSASKDAVLLWDLQTFRQRRMLGAAPYGSSQSTFSPPGNLIAAAAASGEIVLWKTRDLSEVGRLTTPEGQNQQQFTPSCLSISPDERWLVVGCCTPALLLVYNLQSLKLERALLLPAEMYGVVQVQLLPDSSSAAVLASDGSISFVDIHAVSLAAQLQLTSPGSRAVSFSTDARANSMAVVCSDGLVRMYDLAAVRGAAQRQRPVQQVQVMQGSQLQHLPAGSSCNLNGCGKTNDSLQAASAGRHGAPLQVLGELGNLPLKTARKAAEQGRLDARTISSKASAAQFGQLCVLPLDAAAAALNKKKLQDMLQVYGEFPTRYRCLIWDHLLQLPHNSAAFSLLQDKGIHPAYKDLAQQLHGGSRSSQAVRLQACLSQLAHWCPLFGEAGFLPRFVFPFVKLYGPKGESTLEVVATLLLNWCKGWFELFPNPPVMLLQKLLMMLCQQDLQLGGHLQQLGLPLLEQLWHQLSGAMADLLPCQADWLAVWDHCLAAPAGPAFMYHVLCSYLITIRQLLLDVHNEQQLQRLLDSRPAVNIQQVLKQAYRLESSTPQFARLGLDTFTPLPSIADASMGGAYPVFSDYPVGSVELQALERRRIQEAEEALVRRRRVVAELEQRSKQVAFDSSALSAQRQQLAALDAQRKAALRSIDDLMAAAASRLDDRAKEEKLKQIWLVEEAYQGSLASLRSEWQAELAALKSDVEHKRRQTAAALKAKQEEEDLKALEFQAQQRIWALQQEQLAAAGTSCVQDAAAAQAAALAAEQQHKAAEWQAADEARALRQQHEAARRLQLVAAAEQEAARQAAKGLLLAQRLQAQEDLLKVENQRCLRQLAEDEALLTSTQLQLQAERQAVLAAAGQVAVAQKAQEQQAAFSEQQQQRMAAVSAELHVLKQCQQELHMAAADVGTAARLSAAEQQLTKLEQALQQADAEHAAKVQQITKQLQQDKETHEEVMQVLRQTAATPAAAGKHSSLGCASPAQPAATETAAESATFGKSAARIAALTAHMQANATLQGAARAHALTGKSVGTAAAAAGTATAAQPAESERSSAATYRNVVADLQQGLAQMQGVVSAATAAVAGRNGSSSSTGAGSRYASSSASSLNVSEELEQLLAETEAEVRLERSYRQGVTLSQQVQQRHQLVMQKEHALAAARLAQNELASRAAAAKHAATASASAAAGGFFGGSSRLPPVLEGATTSAAAVGATSDFSSAAASPISGVSSAAVKQPAVAVAPGSQSNRANSGILTTTLKNASWSSRPGSAASASSPSRSSPAAELAAAGVGPLTHRGRAMQGRTELLPMSAPQGSSGGSSGSSNSQSFQQQQQTAAQQDSPDTPSSFLTASSTAQSALVTSPEYKGEAVTAAQTTRHQQGGSSRHMLYEPVLIGVGAGGNTGAAGGVPILSDASVSHSSASSPISASQPSSKSLSFDTVEAPAGQTLLERETPMLGGRSRPRTAGNTSTMQNVVSSGTAALQAAAFNAGLRSSFGSSTASAGSEQQAAIEGVRRTSRLGGLGRDPSGRVSAELRQSSSATSEELEQLLQQLSQYESQLLEGQQPSAEASQKVADAGSECGTSMSSLSWSQTLAGLASLLPSNV